ncbi:AAA family ATPase [Candidatus Woesearchaeota archaeon]|nr:AAA family ATPase [Candidatus Woesearchaeota archaeon]
MIIGFTGTIAAGKTTAARFLEGFEHFTYSDILRIEAKKRNIEATRENLQMLGNKVKEESDNNGILSKMIVENATKVNIAADGIRTVDEINELKQFPDAYIIAIDASQKTRYERLKARKRPGDPESFEKFKEIDDHENQGKTPGQDINNAMKHADFLIKNNGSIDKLKKKVEEIMKKITG